MFYEHNNLLLGTIPILSEILVPKRFILSGGTIHLHTRQLHQGSIQDMEMNNSISPNGRLLCCTKITSCCTCNISYLFDRSGSTVQFIFRHFDQELSNSSIRPYLPTYERTYVPTFECTKISATHIDLGRNVGMMNRFERFPMFVFP